MKKHNRNIVFLITGLGVGGAERVVMHLSNSITEYGFNPIIISLTSKNEILSQYPEINCQVHFLNMDYGVLSFLKGILKLTQLIHTLKPVIIHAHMFHALIAGLFSRMINPCSKLVFTSHNFSGFHFPRNLIIMATRGFRNADIVFSAYQHLELNAKHSFVIPNGVPVPQYQPSPFNRHNIVFKFLFIGRLETQKNPVGLIEAFSKMEHKNCELWIAGDGYLRTDIEQRAKELDVFDRVRFLGVRKDIPKLLEEADCLVMPSLWEGLPMVILEAGAASLPVISTPVGAIPDVLDDECGYLSTIRNFPTTMDNIVSNYPEAKLKGEALYRKVLDKFSINNMVERHYELFTQLLMNVNSKG